MPPRDSSRRSRRTSGFTLLEILVALSIMSFVMVIVYTINDVTLETRERLEREVRAASLGPELLDIIEGDLRRVWLRDLDGDRVFHGEEGSLLGEAADRLSLVTTVDSTVTRRTSAGSFVSDVSETGYRLRVNPDVPDVLELWRRQGFHVDEEPLKDGVYERLHDRVVAFDLEYYPDDDERTEPEESWDSGEKHALPAMVSIRLGLEVGPRVLDDRGRTEEGARTVWYERRVPMPRDAELAMRVHALRPTFTASVAGGVAGGGGGGPGGEGGGDPAGGDGGPGGGLSGPDGAPGGPLGGGPGGGQGPPGVPTPGNDSIDLDKVLEELFGGGGG